MSTHKPILQFDRPVSSKPFAAVPSHGDGGGTMNFQQLFSMGMKRELNSLISQVDPAIDVGGNTVVESSPYTRAAGWDAVNGLHFTDDDSVNTIHSFHFFEHLSGDTALFMLREFQRVLKVGGVANVVVPYYSSQMQAQDLDHKSAWTEATWANIFNNPFYSDKGKDWKLKVRFCLIAGIVERNLALFTQLEKV